MHVSAAPLVQRTVTMRRNMLITITGYAIVVLAAVVAPAIIDQLGYSPAEQGWLELLIVGGLAGIGLLGFGALGVHGRLTGRTGRTDELLVTEDSFVAPFCTGDNAMAPLALTPVLALLLPTFARFGSERGWEPGQLAVVAILVGLLLTVIVGYGIGIFRGNHGLVVSPVGVQMPRAFGSLLVPWTALDAQTALPPSKRDSVELVVTDLRQVVRLGPVLPRRVLRVQSSLVNQVFLGEVLRYYVEHPEHQPAIGTPAELDRMRADLADEASRLERAPFFAWSTRA